MPVKLVSARARGADHSFKLWNIFRPAREIRTAEFIQVSATVNSKRIANKIAVRLLGERVASCVQLVGPIESSYWWKGKIEHDKEWLCLIKGRSRDYPRIEAAIKKIHPYEVAEILALPVLYGNNEYLRWIRSETDRRSRAKRGLHS